MQLTQLKSFNQIENQLNIKKIMSKNVISMSIQLIQTCINYNALNVIHFNAVNGNCNDHFHTYMYVSNLQNLLTIATFQVHSIFLTMYLLYFSC